MTTIDSRQPDGKAIVITDRLTSTRVLRPKSLRTLPGRCEGTRRANPRRSGAERHLAAAWPGADR